MWTGRGWGGVVALDLSSERTVQCAWGVDDAADTRYVNLLENGDVETLLSIDGETNRRIVIADSSRYMGLLKQN